MGCRILFPKIITDNMAVVVGLDDITLASIAIKAISDNPAPAR